MQDFFKYDKLCSKIIEGRWSQKLVLIFFASLFIPLDNYLSRYGETAIWNLKVNDRNYIYWPIAPWPLSMSNKDVSYKLRLRYLFSCK